VSEPVIDSNGNLYVCTEGGVVRAIAPDGSEIWNVHLGGVAWLTLGDRGRVFANCDNGTTYALSATDGSEIWARTGMDTWGHTLVVPDGSVYMGDARGHLLALDPSDGSLRQDLGGVIGYMSVGDDGTIYSTYMRGGEIPTLRATDPSTGQLWSAEPEGRTVARPTIGPDGTIYATTLGWDYREGVSAYASDGSLRWAFHCDGTDYDVFSVAVGSDGTVYLPSADGNLYAVNANGTLKWKSWVAYPNSTPCIDGHGRIFVACGDGNIRALDPDDGTALWTFSPGYGSWSPVIGMNQTLYTYGTDYLIAITNATPVTIADPGLEAAIRDRLKKADRAVDGSRPGVAGLSRRVQ